MNKDIVETIARKINHRATVVQYSDEMTYHDKWYALYTLLHLMYDFDNWFYNAIDDFDSERFFKLCSVRLIMDEISEHLSDKKIKQKEA